MGLSVDSEGKRIPHVAPTVLGESGRVRHGVVEAISVPSVPLSLIVRRECFPLLSKPSAFC